MDRDLGAEIDSLREELLQIRKLMIRSHLPRTEPKVPKDDGEVKGLGQECREQLNALRDQLIAYAEDHNESGAIAYTGTFTSGDGDLAMQSVWASAVPTDHLLALNDNRMVEKVLTSVGNGQRLGILLALLSKPMTVNQLVKALGFGSTGQAYHHLKPLVAADIVKEEKGVYTVLPHRMQGIMMLLAGVWDLIDTRYTSGTWDEQS